MSYASQVSGKIVLNSNKRYSSSDRGMTGAILPGQRPYRASPEVSQFRGDWTIAGSHADSNAMLRLREPNPARSLARGRHGQRCRQESRPAEQLRFKFPGAPGRFCGETSQLSLASLNGAYGVYPITRLAQRSPAEQQRQLLSTVHYSSEVYVWKSLSFRQSYIACA